MRVPNTRCAVLCVNRGLQRSSYFSCRTAHSIRSVMQSSSPLSSGGVSTLLSPSCSSPPLPSFSSMIHPTGPPSSTPLTYVPLTLVLCLRPSTATPSTLQLLLGLKKRGFGAGRYNGFGGKLHVNESLHDAARRELREECGLCVLQLDDIGVLVFRFVDRPDKPPLVVHVMRCEQWEGEVVESEEMAPVWVDEADMPYERMWADDRYWYDKVFRGQCFVGDWVMQGMDRVVDGSVDVCSVEQLRQWTWEQHSSERWRATVKMEEQYRAGNSQPVAQT